MAELVGVNYRILPMPSSVQTVAVPERDRPHPGAISGVLKLCWTARTPILVGGDPVFASRSMTHQNAEGQSRRQSGNLYAHVFPIRLFDEGPFCLSGSGLRGMVRAAYSVAAASWPGPIARRKPLLDTTKRRYALHGRGTGLGPITQTIDDLIQRSLPSSDTRAADATLWRGFKVDRTDALFGYVKDFKPGDEGQEREIWRPNREGGPQQLAGRVYFDFALADQAPDFITPFYLPGAEPKLRSPLYTRRDGEDPYPEEYPDPWQDDRSRLAGCLKVYPIHPPDLVALAGASGQPQAGRILHPLDEGAVFTGTIELENVLPEEFGMLMWSLFLGEASDCKAADRDRLHGLGHGRNYGLGALAPELIGGSLEILPDAPGGEQPEAGCLSEYVNSAQKRFSATPESATRRAFLAYRSMQVGERLKEAGRLFAYRQFAGFRDVKNAVEPMLAPENLGEVLRDLDGEVDDFARSDDET